MKWTNYAHGLRDILGLSSIAYDGQNKTNLAKGQ